MCYNITSSSLSHPSTHSDISISKKNGFERALREEGGDGEIKMRK